MRMLETLIFSKLSCVESILCSQGLVSNFLSLCVWGGGGGGGGSFQERVK